jgi:2-methylisocitrate lyase-like PEP mutase family enzyme/ketosteroid isomerase-like protein
VLESVGIDAQSVRSGAYCSVTKSNFRYLHDDFLLLPNAWDAGSARLIESLGAAAIATTSAGVAWSRGYADGNALPLEALLTVAREIARIIKVPLTVDIEGGYSSDPATVAKVVTGVIDAGAVGINIEDGADSPDLLCAKISAARRSAERAGIDLFVNVRTDVFLRDIATGAAAIEEVLRRAELYRAAGGDGLFVPCLSEASAIRTIVKAIAPMPLNVMLVPGLPDIDSLRKLGVRRLSAGSAIAQATLGLTEHLARDFLAGSWSEMFAKPAEYMTVNRLFDVILTGKDDFEQFLKLRKEASDEFINGNFEPLNSISTHQSPATIFGPKGDCVQGAEQVNSANASAAKLFKPGGTNAFEIMHMAADGNLAYWVGIQRSVVRMQGQETPIPMDLRVTEIFRREGGAWKLVHRHADKLKAA